jgi:hypothetical protein
MYQLYHIKGVKWGCSKELPNRLKRQGYTLNDVCEIVEEYNIDIASELEKEWNIRDGYSWNDSQDYRIITKAAPMGGKAAVQNMLNKRPSTKGENNAKAFLTKTDVLNIRKDYENAKKGYGTLSSLATKYNLKHGHISSIIKRKIWKHI